MHFEVVECSQPQNPKPAWTLLGHHIDILHRPLIISSCPAVGGTCFYRRQHGHNTILFTWNRSANNFRWPRSTLRIYCRHPHMPWVLKTVLRLRKRTDLVRFLLYEVYGTLLDEQSLCTGGYSAPYATSRGLTQNCRHSAIGAPKSSRTHFTLTGHGCRRYSSWA